MIGKACLMFALVALIDVNAQGAQDNNCATTFADKIQEFAMNSQMNKENLCPAYEDMSVCLIKQMGEAMGGLSDAVYDMAETQLQQQLDSQPELQGFNCEVDLRAAVARAEAGGSGTGGNTGGDMGGNGGDMGGNGGDMGGNGGDMGGNGGDMGGSDALQKCSTDLMKAMTSLTDKNNICSIYETMLNCIMDAEPDKKIEDKDIEEFNKGFNEAAKNMQATCTLDAKEVAKAKGRYAGDGNGAASLSAFSFFIVAGLSAVLLTTMN